MLKPYEFTKYFSGNLHLCRRDFCLKEKNVFALYRILILVLVSCRLLKFAVAVQEFIIHCTFESVKLEDYSR